MAKPSKSPGLLSRRVTCVFQQQTHNNGLCEKERSNALGPVICAFEYLS